MAWSTPRTWSATELVTPAMLNQEVRDNLNAALPVGPDAWPSWSPTWTNLTVGNGTLSAHYMKVGRGVHVYLRFTLGSTSAVGTQVRFTLPVAVGSGLVTDALLGNAMFTDTGTNIYSGFAEWDAAAGNCLLRVWNAASTYVTFADLQSTVPHTWAATDVISTSFTYEAAS